MLCTGSELVNSCHFQGSTVVLEHLAGDITGCYRDTKTQALHLLKEPHEENHLR